MIIRIRIPMLLIARNTSNIQVVTTPAIAVEVVPTPAPRPSPGGRGGYNFDQRQEPARNNCDQAFPTG